MEPNLSNECLICNCHFSSAEARNSHCLKEHINVSSKCPICQLVLAPGLSLQSHLQLLHPGRLICPPILKRNHGMDELNNNTISSVNVHNERIHQCVKCSYVSTNTSNLARHVESFHLDYECKHCLKSIQGRKNLALHLRKDHRIRTSLRDYFNGTEFEEEFDADVIDPKKRKKKVSEQPCFQLQRENCYFPMIDASEAAKAEAAFDRCANFSSQKVQVLPIFDLLQSWEL